MSKERPLQSMAIVIGLCWTNFYSQKLKRRILATFSFNRTAISATQPMLHSIFAQCFWRSHYQPLNWFRLATSELRFDTVGLLFVGAVKDKCYADKLGTIDVLKNNIREAIGEIQLLKINNVLKNWTDCVSYCMANRGSHLNRIIFHY